MTIVALIPARAGSKRIPGKNTRLLAGRPLIAYTIAAAQQSGIFADIQIWTDDPALHMYAAEHFSVRTYVREPSSDDEPDIAWVRVWAKNATADAFAILRPTSPFRTAVSIRLAHQCFSRWPCDSIRAVRRAHENPYKMWWPRVGEMIRPVFEKHDTKGTPYHSLPSQFTMGSMYVQTGSLEMAWTRVVAETQTISGEIVYPFHQEGPETFDLNTEDDWAEAQRLIAQGVPLPLIETSCPR